MTNLEAQKLTRTWLGNVFEHVAIIQPDRDSEGRVVHHDPAPRYAHHATKRLNRHGKGPFCSFSLSHLSIESGVYAITANANLVYIGECANLAERWGSRGYASIQPRNCYQGGQSTNCHINNLILQSVERREAVDLWFTAIEPRKQIEAELRARLRPSWNLA